MTTFAQYFSTIGYGATGGLRIHVETHNPGTGKNTVPTRVDISLRAWGGSYSGSQTTTLYARNEYTIPSEEVQQYTWIPLIFWDDLAEGEYIWFMTTLSGPEDGSFRVLYDAGSTKFNAWKDGVSHDDYQSEILGLDSGGMTYEKAISEGDTFGLSTYTTMNGVDSPQINTPGGYKKAISTYTTGAYVKSGSKITGRIAGGSYVKNI